MKIGRWLVLFLLVIFVWRWYNRPIVLQQKIELKEGAGFYSVLSDLSFADSLKMKLYIKRNTPDFSKLAPGYYQLSGEYRPVEFVSVFLDGPEMEYIPYTVLEGWSVYDVDHDLAKKNLIQAGDYLAQVFSQSVIDEYAQKYSFLPQDISSFEGFLYPDTYHLNKGQDVIGQLLRMQLDAFDKKIYVKYETDISEFYSRVKRDYKLDFGWYDIVKIASVVEKEERNSKNKPIVAGIFFNRLQDGMRLDADITLCYGLKEPYETCTPQVIVKSIHDENNIFNTRVKSGLVPQPISSVSAQTIQAVLSYQKTDNYYYLHDNAGMIHYAETIGEHNANKNLYLN